MKGFGAKKKSKKINDAKQQQLQKSNLIAEAFKLHSKGDIIQAEKKYKLIIDSGFDDPRVFTNYGNIEKGKGNIKNAVYLYKRSIEIYPKFVLSYFNLANIYKDEGNNEEAEIYYRKTINIDPEFILAYNNLASILIERGIYDESRSLLEKVIMIDQEYYEAYNNLGAIYNEIRQFDKAELYIKKSIEINNKFPDSYYNLGKVYNGLGRLVEAEEYLCKAIEIEPDIYTIKELFEVYLSLGKYDQALEIANNSLKTIPSDYQLNFLLLKLYWRICDWELLEKQLIKLNKLTNFHHESGPMIFMYLEDQPFIQLNRSIAYYDYKFRCKPKEIKFVEKSKTRIGYFSNGFYQHSTMVLLARIIELHNKNSFEIYIYDYGIHKEDSYTKRIKACSDKYYSVHNLSNNELVELARKDELDIAIDLMGYTKLNRAIIFSYRLAPVQVSYLDYPGSTGNKSIDYILADKTLIPKSDEIFYTEKVVRMPYCLQPTDDQLTASEAKFSRSNLGFKEGQFVFSCFAGTQKIQRREFTLWMDLLLFNDKSVLWLIYSNEQAKNNLLKEATLKGIDRSRIVFSEYIDIRDHMKRQDCADLQLDTFNFNSGTMSCLSLKTGLPILTLPGNTYSSRITASVLKVLGLEELIATSEENYLEIAKHLSTNRHLIVNLKKRILSLQSNSPYFDSLKYCVDLENVFMEMINNKNL